MFGADRRKGNVYFGPEDVLFAHVHAERANLFFPWEVTPIADFVAEFQSIGDGSRFLPPFSKKTDPPYFHCAGLLAPCGYKSFTVRAMRQLLWVWHK